MTERFAGRRALVTGGASGIGAATAALLVVGGAQVWLADLDVASAEAQAREIGAAGAVRLDVTSLDDWTGLFHERPFGPAAFDVLINAAGISMTKGASSVAEVTLDDWRRVFAVNVEGTLLACQHAMREMATYGGSIVNISSTTAMSPSATLAAYGASKAAVLQLTKSVAAACAVAGLAIRCNAVLPGMTETPMTGGLSDGARAAWEAQIPLGRFAKPVEVAEV